MNAVNKHTRSETIFRKAHLSRRTRDHRRGRHSSTFGRPSRSNFITPDLRIRSAQLPVKTASFSERKWHSVQKMTSSAHCLLLFGKYGAGFQIERGSNMLTPAALEKETKGSATIMFVCLFKQISLPDKCSRLIAHISRDERVDHRSKKVNGVCSISQVIKRASFTLPFKTAIATT